MRIEIEKTGSVQGLAGAIERCLHDSKVKGILILACDENDFAPAEIDPLLKKIKVPIFGGLFPQIVRGMEKYTRGSLVIGLDFEIAVRIIPNLSDFEIDFDDEIETQMENVAEFKTMFVLVDGFAKRISALIEGIFNIFGLEHNFIGGGAGSLSLVQNPCLFTNDGLIQDAALLVATTAQSAVGVKHGWEDIAGPFRVTEAEANTIKSLDWQPAFEVYRKIIDEHSGGSINESNFFDLAKCYPFGISKLGAEKVVRDPIMVQNGELVCVGEVPRDSFVHILTGNANSLVEAASEAHNVAISEFTGQRENSFTLFISCISRVLFLQDEFHRELDAVNSENSELVGALTIGEIANNGKDYFEFYNKTAVVGIVEA